MTILVQIWLASFLYLYVDGKTNITSYFRIGLNFTNPRDGCTEYTSHCFPVNSILANSTCYNNKLSYKYTIENTKDFLQLEYWSPLRAIPKCWTYLKTLICSLKYPECSRTNSEWFINKPAHEICQAALRECSFLKVANIDDKTNKSNSAKSKLNHIKPIVDKTPFFLDCDRYPSNCPVDFHKRMIHHNDLLSCQWPMVNTVQETLWIDGFDGCAFYCKTPFFSAEEYQLTKSIFGVVGLMFFLFNAFVLITFLIHQFQHSNHKWHPMLLNLFIIHFYMLLGSLGWMMQLIPGIGNSIVCRLDGALQIREPQVKVGESMWCVVVFSMIYFSLFASSLSSLSFFYFILSVISRYSHCWAQSHSTCTSEDANYSSSVYKFPFLTKKFRFSLRKSDNEKKFNFQSSEMSHLNQDKNEIRFSGMGINNDSINARNHSLSSQLFVVLISVSLLIISLTVGEIKGDPLSGICFVANDSIVVRICLSLLPLTIILVALSIIINIIIAHIRIIQKHLDLYASVPQKIHSKRMSKTSTFYVFILIFLWMFWCFSVYTHYYIFNNEKLWYQALKNQFICKLRQSLLPSISRLDVASEMMICPLETRPSFGILTLNNLSYFAINIVFLLCSCFNRHWIFVWKTLFRNLIFLDGSYNFTCTRDKDKSRINKNIVIEKLYFGLQNKSLLDSIWNPGIFVYLTYKNEKKMSCRNNVQNIMEDKTATLGSVDNSSASYCLYPNNGSLRSCVSMPPINVVGPHNMYQCFQNLSRESEICPNLENFLKGTQNFIGQNSVRRSNSYAGSPYLVPNSPVGNISIPNSCYHSGLVNQRNSFFKDSLIHNNRTVGLSRNNDLENSNNNCFLNNNQDWADKPHDLTLNGCNSMSHLTVRRNTFDNSSIKNNKSVRRLSMTFDRKNEKGISSKSSLNRRKRIARYSVSPKSISKVLTNQSTAHSRLGDPSSGNSSSFSAESYNSYNLMAQQIGGRWRDICRTRTTLQDVMMWAKAASQNHMSMHGICQNSVCNYCIPKAGCNHAPDTSSSKLLNLNKQCSGSIPHSLICSNSNNNTNIFKVNDLSSNDYHGQETKLHYGIDCDQEQIINSHLSVDSNNSSDKFNSEDEIVSAENSTKNSTRESGEFCSDDEVISLINSENQ